MTWSNPTKSPTENWSNLPGSWWVGARSTNYSQRASVGGFKYSWKISSFHPLLGDSELLRMIPNSRAAFWDRWKNHWPDLTSLFIWFWHQGYFSNWKVFESTLYDRPNAVINNCYRYVLGAGPLRITGITSLGVTLKISTDCRHTPEISPFLLRISAFLMVFPVKFHPIFLSRLKRSRPGSLFVLPNAGNTYSQAESHSAGRLGNPWTKHQRSTYLLGAWRTQGPKTNIDFPERRCHSEPWDLQLQPDPSSCMSVSNEDGSKPMIFK